MPYYFRAVMYPNGLGYTLRPLFGQKRKGRNLGRHNLVAQWRLPRLSAGDIVEVEELVVRYSSMPHYEPRGYVRRVAREKP